MTPKVLVDLSVAPLGGAGTYARGVASGLAGASELELPDKGALVVVVDAGWAAANPALVTGLEGAGIEVDAVEFPPPGTWAARLGRGRILRAAAARHQVDAVVFPRDVGPKMAVPVVIELKNLYAWHPFGSGSAIGGRFAARMLRWAAHRSARRAAAVAAVSQVIADATPDDVTVHAIIHHGCDLVADDRSTPREEGPCRAVMVGNAIANKGFEVAIDAVAHRRLAGHDVMLDIYGNRSDEQYATELDQRAVERLGEPVLRGPVDLAGLGVAYRRADLFLMGGSFESFCMPLVEAMRSGCVVVAPDVPIVAELCGEVAVTYREGDPTSMADAIDRAWTERRERIGLGVERSGRFRWEVAAAAIVLLARDVAR